MQILFFKLSDRFSHGCMPVGGCMGSIQRRLAIHDNVQP